MEVYKTNLISTIVDSVRVLWNAKVYKTNLISTIVDICNFFERVELSIRLI